MLTSMHHLSSIPCNEVLPGGLRCTIFLFKCFFGYVFHSMLLKKRERTVPRENVTTFTRISKMVNFSYCDPQYVFASRNSWICFCILVCCTVFESSKDTSDRFHHFFKIVFTVVFWGFQFMLALRWWWLYLHDACCVMYSISKFVVNR